MEEKILTQEDDMEDDIDDLEEEMKDTEEAKPTKTKKAEIQSEGASETYESFMQPARLGIVNTINGEVIEGFEISKDEGIVQLGKAILNKLDKIAIASGV